MKRCFKCGETKVSADFNVHRTRKDGLQSMCRECQRVCGGTPAARATRARYKKSPAGKVSSQSSRRRSGYGLEPGDYKELLDAQGVICKLPKCARDATHIDHDHSKSKGEPGFIRGMLCAGHNQALGHFNDDPAYLLDAIAYLRGELKERPPFGGPESPTVKLD